MIKTKLVSLCYLMAFLVALPTHAENWRATDWPELNAYGEPVCQLWSQPRYPTLSLTTSGAGGYLEVGAFSMSNVRSGDPATLRFSDAPAMQLAQIEKTDWRWALAYLTEDETEEFVDRMRTSTDLTVEIGPDSITLLTETAAVALDDFRNCRSELSRIYQTEQIPR